MPHGRLLQAAAIHEHRWVAVHKQIVLHAMIAPATGHLWGVATHKKDVSPEEMAQGAAQWGKQQAA